MSTVSPGDGPAESGPPADVPSDILLSSGALPSGAKNAQTSRQTEDAKSFGPARALGWMIFGTLVVILFVGGVRACGLPVNLPIAGALSGVAFFALSWLLLWRYPTKASAPNALGWKPASLKTMALGLILGFALRGPAEVLRRVWLALLHVPSPSVETLEAPPAMFVAGMLVTMALVVPLAEETFFRGAVFETMIGRGKGRWLTALVTGVGFALAHPQTLLPILSVALALSVLRASSKSLLPTFLAHSCFNGVEVLRVGSLLPRWLGSPVAVALQTAVVVLCIAWCAKNVAAAAEGEA